MKLTIILLVTVLIGYVYTFKITLDEANQWKKFLSKNKIKYTNSSISKARQSVFLKNLREVNRHNELFKAGKVSWSKSLHKHSDLTKEEFISTRCGTRHIASTHNSPTSSVSQTESAPQTELPTQIESDSPSEWDIRSQGPGQLAEIKDQGSCASCWAFATAAALENSISIQTGEILSLSEQQQVDCNKDCYGCNGGFIQRAFIYTENGLSLESDYPYMGETGTCKTGLTSAASNVGFINLDSDTATIQSHVSSIGSCTVCVDGNNWYDYSNGTFNGAGDNPKCNHAVLIIGYGPGYWLIRNSWGTDWGMEGYIKVEDSTAGGIFKNMVYCPTF